nr:MAG TPA: hypothetical protein [Caudoviricetes sp.]
MYKRKKDSSFAVLLRLLYVLISISHTAESCK